MTIRNQADFWAGILFLAFGLVFLLMARNYDFGTPLRMGPSFFPMVLSIALVAIGAVTALRSLVVPGDPIEGFAMRGLVLITLGAVLFGLLVDTAGLLVAVTAVVLVSASASAKFTWKRSLVMSAVLAAFSALVFVYGLGVPIPIVGPMFGG